MSARNVAALASLALLLIVAGCTGFYEIPIETPIRVVQLAAGMF